MPPVHHHGKDPTLSREPGRAFQRRNRGLRHRGHAVVRPGQISQVEHGCAHLPGYIPCKVRMRIPDQRGPTPKSGGIKPGRCPLNGFRLEVKSKDVLAGPALPGKKQRIVSVAAGRIQQEFPGPVGPGDYGMHKDQYLMRHLT